MQQTVLKKEFAKAGPSTPRCESAKIWELGVFVHQSKDQIVECKFKGEWLEAAILDIKSWAADSDDEAESDVSFVSAEPHCTGTPFAAVVGGCCLSAVARASARMTLTGGPLWSNSCETGRKPLSWWHAYLFYAPFTLAGELSEWPCSVRVKELQNTPTRPFCTRSSSTGALGNL